MNLGAATGASGRLLAARRSEELIWHDGESVIVRAHTQTHDGAVTEPDKLTTRYHAQRKIHELRKWQRRRCLDVGPLEEGCGSPESGTCVTILKHHNVGASLCTKVSVVGSIIEGLEANHCLQIE